MIPAVRDSSREPSGGVARLSTSPAGSEPPSGTWGRTRRCDPARVPFADEAVPTLVPKRSGKPSPVLSPLDLEQAGLGIREHPGARCFFRVTKTSGRGVSPGPPNDIRAAIGGRPTSSVPGSPQPNAGASRRICVPVATADARRSPLYRSSSRPLDPAILLASRPRPVLTPIVATFSSQLSPDSPDSRREEARRLMNTPNPKAQSLLIMEGESGTCHGEFEFCFGSWSLHTHENPYRLMLCVMLEHSLQAGLERVPWQAITWTLKRGSDVFYVVGDSDDRYPGPHYSTTCPPRVENILVWLLSHRPTSSTAAHGY